MYRFTAMTGEGREDEAESLHAQQTQQQQQQQQTQQHDNSTTSSADTYSSQPQASSSSSSSSNQPSSSLSSFSGPASLANLPRQPRVTAQNILHLSSHSASPPPPPSPPHIIHVWQHNLRHELSRLSELCDSYPYVSMDTEFPGVVARPIGNFKSKSEYVYSSLKLNVDMLKLIQLGLTLLDEDGNLVPGEADGSGGGGGGGGPVGNVWQFHFQFSLDADMYAQDSIDLLLQSGLNFQLHASDGIDVAEFSELLITSGLILNPDITFVTFHSSYDFAYLLRLATASPLPATEADFFDLLALYFPRFIDIKHVLHQINSPVRHSGLNAVAASFQCQRIGGEHQAGSDSLLTAAVWWRMRQVYQTEIGEMGRWSEMLFGLGSQQAQIQYAKEKEAKELARAAAAADNNHALQVE